MPVKTKNTNKIEGCNINDQIDELKRKYHLKKKDFDAYHERTKEEIRINELTISKMRQENKAMHILLAKHENGDLQVIQNVFAKNTKERLSLQRCTAAEAIEEMDQNVCATHTYLNALRYASDKKAVKLRELSEEYSRMLKLENEPNDTTTPTSPQQQQQQQTESMLENSLDKAIIKYDTAKVITQHYRDIIDKLQEESLTLPAKLTAMEEAAYQQKLELKELRKMFRDAVESRDLAKRVLQEVEREAFRAKRLRDTELSRTRKEVERRRAAEAERVERRAGAGGGGAGGSQRTAALLGQDSADQRGAAVQQQQQRRETQRRLLGYEEALERMRDAARVTDVTEVAERARVQRQTGERLSAQARRQEAQLARLRDTLAEQRRAYHEMKYSGERQGSRAARLVSDMQARVERERAGGAGVQERLTRAGHALVEVRTGVSTLLDKLASVRLPPPHHNQVGPGADVFDELRLARLKLERLLSDTARLSAGWRSGAALDRQLRSASFHDFLETQLSPDNLRVKVESGDEGGELGAFDYSSDEGSCGDEVLGRLDIKRQGQRLVESKQKQPKKRRAKKK